jgi:hypothetical protein
MAYEIFHRRRKFCFNGVKKQYFEKCIYNALTRQFLPTFAENRSNTPGRLPHTIFPWNKFHTCRSIVVDFRLQF